MINKFKVTDNKKVKIANANAKEPIGELLYSSYQGVKRLYVFAYDDTEYDNKVSVEYFKKYFLSRVKIEN